MLKDGSQFDETNPIHRCIVIVSSMVIESTLYRQKMYLCVIIIGTASGSPSWIFSKWS